jgi:hypothetical protein
LHRIVGISSLSPVKRMARIDRQAVVANGRPVALMCEAAQAIVARFAKASNRAGEEQIVIAAMRRKVIRDRRRGDLPPFLAQDAQGRDPQLVLGARSPTLKRIP